MDIASLLGIILGAAMTVVGIVTGKAGVSALSNFFDLPSVIITIGGSLAGVLGCHKLQDFKNGFKGFSLAIKAQKQERKGF